MLRVIPSGLFALVAVFLSSVTVQAQLYWRVDGTAATWTGANWSATGAAPYTTAWTANSNAVFAADSAVTFASTSVGNVSVAASATVTVTAAGTMSTNGSVRTFDVGAGGTLNWASQSVSTTAGTGFIKNGTGTWNVGGWNSGYTGGFTLNAGTVVASTANAFGVDALAVNGGIIQSSGTTAFNLNTLTVGGDFGLSGTGTTTISASVGLGAASRTLTNTATGSRILSGQIAGGAGVGLTFAGTGTTYVSNNSNSFTGDVAVTGGEAGFVSDGAFGGGAKTITVDGGRLTASNSSGAGVTYSLAATRSVLLGSTAGTSLNVPASGSLTVSGVVADKVGSAGVLNKQGAGTLTLGGVNTYTGATTIAGGTLTLAAGGSISATPVVTVGTGATFNVSAVAGGYVLGASTAQTLNGVGTVTGATTVAATGTVQGGTGSVNQALTTGNLSFQNGGKLQAAVGGSAAVDTSLATGAGRVAAAVFGRSGSIGVINLVLTNDGATPLGDLSGATTYARRVATYTSLTNLTAGTTYTAADGVFAVTTAGGNFGVLSNWSVSVSGGNVDVTFTPVPEPAAVLAVAAGGLGLLRLRRRLV